MLSILREVFKLEEETLDTPAFKMKEATEEDPKCIDTDRLELRESLKEAIPTASELW